MKKNMGTTGRVVRLVAGVAIITFGIIYQSWFGLVGILPLTMAAVGWCPLCSCGSGKCSTGKCEI